MAKSAAFCTYCIFCQFLPATERKVARTTGGRGRKSDDNDDTCSHSGLSEEEEEGKRLEEISEVRKKWRLPSARSILEHVCVNAGEKIKSEYGFLNGWKGTS